MGERPDHEPDAEHDLRERLRPEGGEERGVAGARHLLVDEEELEEVTAARGHDRVHAGTGEVCRGHVTAAQLLGVGIRGAQDVEPAAGAHHLGELVEHDPDQQPPWVERHRPVDNQRQRAGDGVVQRFDPVDQSNSPTPD